MKATSSTRIIFVFTLIAAATVAQYCDDTANAAIGFRDTIFYENGHFKGYFDSLRKKLMTFAFDLRNDDDLRALACEIQVYQPQRYQAQFGSIDDLKRSLQNAGLALGQDPHLETALLYVYLKGELSGRLQELTYARDFAKNSDRLFRELDFPNFPSALTEDQIDDIVRSFPEEFLCERFPYSAYCNANGYERTHNVSALVTALANAQTINDFKRLLDVGLWVKYEVPDSYKHEEEYQALTMLASLLKRNGLWTIQRSIVNTDCADVIDDIMDFVGTAKEYFGDVLTHVAYEYGLDVILHKQPEEMKTLICQIIDVKSQSEIRHNQLLPQVLRDHAFYYTNIANAAMSFLSNPEIFVEPINVFIRKADALMNINFPKFPYQLPLEEARKVTNDLVSYGGVRFNRTVKAFTSAKSLEDAEYNYIYSHELHEYTTILEVLGKRENQEALKKLFFLAYRCLSDLERGGFFMLPE